mmetsp:Transcript_3540/g.9529  ORF Transcript_3540/g.9529 Transcript_3540/m.9529 type:complete len:90 (+) Transcript_3540:1833-2102(+)
MSRYHETSYMLFDPSWPRTPPSFHTPGDPAVLQEALDFSAQSQQLIFLSASAGAFVHARVSDSDHGCSVSVRCMCVQLPSSCAQSSSQV